MDRLSLDAIDGIRQRATASPDDITALVACPGDAQKAVQRRAADALAAVHRAGGDVIAPIRVALAAATLGHRWGAAYALGRAGVTVPEVLPVLFDVCGSDDGDRRWAAAQMLVSMGPTDEVIAALRTRLAASNPMARKMALYCLRDLQHAWPGCDDDLSAALADLDPSVRLAALNAVPALAHDRERLAGACLRCLADPALGVSRAAATAVGCLGVTTPSILAALAAAVAGPDAARARAAQGALRRLGSPASAG